MKLGPQSFTRLPGRGMVNTAVSFLPHFVHLVKWWLNSLRWTATPDEQGLPAAVDNTASYLECAVDFELATGVRLTSNSGARLAWADQAARLYRIIRAIARTHTLVLHGVVSTLKAALAPKTNVPSLTPLGAPMSSGFARRPRWLAKGTTEVVAANVSRALEAARSQHAQGGRATRTFAKNWYLDFSGYPHEGQWQPEPLTSLKARLQQQIDGLAASTTAQRDQQAAENQMPDVPLPTITREMKAGVLNGQLVRGSGALCAPPPKHGHAPAQPAWNANRIDADTENGPAPPHSEDAAADAGGSGASSSSSAAPRRTEDGARPTGKNGAAARATSEKYRTQDACRQSLGELESVRELLLLVADARAKRQHDEPLRAGAPTPISSTGHQRGTLADDDPTVEGRDIRANLFPKQLELASPSAGCIFGHQCKPLPFRATRRTWRGAPLGSLLCAKCFVLYSRGHN